MRRATIAVGTALCAVGLAAFAWRASRHEPPASAGTEIGPGHVEHLHLDAPGQGRTRDVYVYRPAVRDSAALPVVYFLHGFPGEAYDVFDAGAKAILDRLFASGTRPFVLVAPDGQGATHEDTEWADARDGSDQVETWVTTTVRDAVEAGHPRDRRHRAIAGFSMGGYGAANLAFRHSDLYGQLVSIAGYFRVDDPDHVFGANATTIAANTPLEHVDAARDMRVGLFDAVGEDVELVQGQAAQLHDALAADGIASTVRFAPGVHGWTYAATVLDDAFRFLADGYR